MVSNFDCAHSALKQKTNPIRKENFIMHSSFDGLKNTVKYACSAWNGMKGAGKA